MWKKILLIAGCVIAGLIVGFLAAIMIVVPNMSKAMFMMQEKEIFELGEAAQNAYLNEPNEVALWAMTTYLKRLDNLATERNIGEDKPVYCFLNPVDRVIANARIWNLYYRIGEKDKAQEHFRLATECAKGTCFEAMKTEEDWLKLVHRMDESALKRHEENK